MYGLKKGIEPVRGVCFQTSNERKKSSNCAVLDVERMNRAYVHYLRVKGTSAVFDVEDITRHSLFKNFVAQYYM